MNGIIVVGIGLLVVSVVALALWWFCRIRSVAPEDEEQGDERSALLSSTFRSRYLKRTPTFYQWNRPPPTPPPSTTNATNDDESSNSQQESRMSRRKELLKKYARSPSFVGS
ncbi:hypothetical protein BJV82DRAFT_590935 [Fennellomyces sp. T-0311]|nr:hypothetical protein BJV82DRAFT_590935 [Fennellomyces sp. T-0311]